MPNLSGWILSRQFLSGWKPPSNIAEPSERPPSPDATPSKKIRYINTKEPPKPDRQTNMDFHALPPPQNYTITAPKETTATPDAMPCIKIPR